MGLQGLPTRSGASIWWVTLTLPFYWFITVYLTLTLAQVVGLWTFNPLPWTVQIVLSVPSLFVLFPNSGVPISLMLSHAPPHAQVIATSGPSTLAATLAPHHLLLCTMTCCRAWATVVDSWLPDLWHELTPHAAIGQDLHCPCPFNLHCCLAPCLLSCAMWPTAMCELMLLTCDWHWSWCKPTPCAAAMVALDIGRIAAASTSSTLTTAWPLSAALCDATLSAAVSRLLLPSGFHPLSPYNLTSCPPSAHLSCHYWPAFCTNLQSLLLQLQPWFHLGTSFISSDALAASMPPNFHPITTLPSILATTRPLSLCSPLLVILWLCHIIIGPVFLALYIYDINLFIVKHAWQ